jgi:NAD(P)-dependent dehydrogenase (short-subunit alcohol dehydrogenase family)
MIRMEGQVALVTGGTRGIGLAISERLIRRGVRVAAGFNRDAEAAKRLVESHPEAVISLHQGDVADPQDCRRIVEEALEEHGRLDILVNNAGITRDRTVRRMALEEWDDVVGVNLSGAFYLCRAAINQMIDAGYGRIVNVSSVIGEKGNVGQANYSAAKSGLFGLTKSLALETARSGISVNAVAPGFIRTDMVAALPDAVLEKIIPQVPVGRLGEPDEVARLVEFLVDPGSGYITGEIYGINGGLYM